MNPDPATLAIEDIAHALSHVNRYTGHTFRPYSVARHSITVAELVRVRGCSREAQLWALLHDATEAYLNDIAAPVKQSPIFAGYRAAEKHLERVIQERFMGFQPSTLMAEAVKRADWDMLLAERERVLPPGAWVAERAPADARTAFCCCDDGDTPERLRTSFGIIFDHLGGVR